MELYKQLPKKMALPSPNPSVLREQSLGPALVHPKTQQLFLCLLSVLMEKAAKHCEAVTSKLCWALTSPLSSQYSMQLPTSSSTLAPGNRCQGVPSPGPSLWIASICMLLPLSLIWVSCPCPWPPTMRKQPLSLWHMARNQQGPQRHVTTRGALALPRSLWDL